MSLADHFGNSMSSGFMRRRVAQQAARQFQVSLGLLIVLIIAAISLSAVTMLDSHAVTVSQWFAP